MVARARRRGPAIVAEDIIGGTPDTGDSAIVLLYMTVPGQSGGSLCTGEVISPHVVLTAAHCTGGEDPSVTNAVWRVYLGPDFSKATTADMLAVKEAHYDPKFDINNLPGGSDVGVAILQNALPSTIVPLPLNRAAMAGTLDGQPIRFVGYGLDNATAQTGAGVKRTTTTTLSDVTELLVALRRHDARDLQRRLGRPGADDDERQGDDRRPDLVRRRQLQHGRLGYARRCDGGVDRRLRPTGRPWIRYQRRHGAADEYATVPLRWLAVSPDVVRDADAPLVDGRGRRWGELRFRQRLPVAPVRAGRQRHPLLLRRRRQRRPGRLLDVARVQRRRREHGGAAFRRARPRRRAATRARPGAEMSMRNQTFRRIVDGAVAIEDRDAFVERLTAALPEARVIKQVTDDHTSRVITFELLTQRDP